MIRVYGSGGLGNQLFQFAFAHYLSCTLGYDVNFQNVSSQIGIPHTRFNLANYLSDSVAVPERRKQYRLMQAMSDPWHSYRLRIGWGQRYDFRLDPAISPSSLPSFRAKGYAVGYFQHYDFVEPHEDYLVKLFLNLMSFNNDCHRDNPYEVVHIRGGDSLSTRNKSRVGKLDSTYYARALEDNRGIPRIILTDDLNFAKSILYGIKFDELYSSNQQSTLEAFGMLSRASRVVTSNSTFSWWGALLASRSRNAEIIVPKPFFQSKELLFGRGLYVPGFKEISVQ